MDRDLQVRTRAHTGAALEASNVTAQDVHEHRLGNVISIVTRDDLVDLCHQDERT